MSYFLEKRFIVIICALFYQGYLKTKHLHSVDLILSMVDSLTWSCNSCTYLLGLESRLGCLLEDEQRFGLGILMRQYSNVSFRPFSSLLLVFDLSFIVFLYVFMLWYFVCVL